MSTATLTQLPKNSTAHRVPAVAEIRNEFAQPYPIVSGASRREAARKHAVHKAGMTVMFQIAAGLRRGAPVESRLWQFTFWAINGFSPMPLTMPIAEQGDCTIHNIVPPDLHRPDRGLNFMPFKKGTKIHDYTGELALGKTDITVPAHQRPVVGCRVVTLTGDIVCTLGRCEPREGDKYDNRLAGIDILDETSGSVADAWTGRDSLETEQVRAIYQLMLTDGGVGAI